MGSSLQRLEVLIIGLIVLLAGAVVAIIMVLRPLSPSQYQATTPQPIASSAAGGPASVPPQTSVTPLTAIPTAAPITPIPVATSAPKATVAPAVINTLPVTPVPLSTTGVAPDSVMPSLAVPPTVRDMWPWLVLLAGPIGGLVVGMRIRRQRRMTYTNQSVGQLLATADATTRDTNLKIMHDLAAQGLLTAELAAVAGIDLAQPQQQHVGRLPRFRVPRLRIAWPRRLGVRLAFGKLRALRVAMPRLHRRRQRPLTIDLTRTAPTSADGNSMTNDALLAVSADETSPGTLTAGMTASAPNPASGLDIALPDGAPVGHLPEAPRLAMPALQDAALVAVELDTELMVDEHAAPWTSEERARAVANLMAELWVEGTLLSPIVALDTASMSGDGQVMVSIDQHPDEVDRLTDLPESIVARCANWRAAWRRDLLEVIVATNGTSPPIGGSLILPILTHGRGGKITRYFPLASWRNLAFYGSDALGVLHAALGSLLYAQPPTHLGLAILDQGQIMPLYRHVAHLVPLPASPCETIERLAQAIKRGAHDDTRPLVLVVVEPDDTMLNLLFGIAARLQARPTTPVHLLIAQEHVSSAGRELYALLPALILGGARGATAVLPGQGDWPKRGEARLIARGMRIEGRAITWDEAAIAAAVAELRGQPTNLPPVLLDTPVYVSAPPAAMRVVDEQPRAVDMDGIEPAQRIVDAEPAAAPDLIENTVRDGQDVLINDHDTRDIDCVGNPRFADVEAAASSAITPTIERAAPMSPCAIAAMAAEDAADGAAPIVSLEPMLVPEPTTSAAIVAASYDLTNQPASSPNEPGAAQDTPTSRRAALLRASRDVGSATAAPLHMVPLRAGVASPLIASAVVALPEPPPMVEPDHGWPIGPAPLGRVAMADLLARMIATPAIVAGQVNELGVTKNRVVDLLKGAHKAQAKELAEILMVWLDLADLLVEPTRPGRLRHPRALTTTNLAEIAARLNATPCPDKGTVKAMWVESNEGRA